MKEGSKKWKEERKGRKEGRKEGRNLLDPRQRACTVLHEATDKPVPIKKGKREGSEGSKGRKINSDGRKEGRL